MLEKYREKITSDDKEKIRNLKKELERLEQKNSLLKLLTRNHIKKQKLEYEINSIKKRIEEKETKDISPEEIKKYMDETEDITLNENDRISNNKKIANQSKKIKEIGDLVLIHKTSYAPSDNTIKTPLSTKKKVDIPVMLSEKEYTIKYQIGNNSIHFGANCYVTSHPQRDWNDRDIAVITPMTSCKKNKILTYLPGDTFSEGDFKLGEGSYILCPPKRKKELKEKNPGVKIICYENISLDEAIEILLVNIGKKVKTTSVDGWIHNEDDEFNKILIENNYHAEEGEKHLNSREYVQKHLIEKISIITGIIECIINNNIETTTEEVMKQLDIYKVNQLIPYYQLEKKDINQYIKMMIKELHLIGYDLSEETMKKIEKVYQDTELKYDAKIIPDKSIRIINEIIISDFLKYISQQKSTMKGNIEGNRRKI